MRRALWSLVIAVPVVLLLASGFGRDPGVVASPLLNRPAPSFALRTVEGTTLSLRALRGRPLVLNFWASWCPACKAEHGYLLTAYRRYRRAGVAFVGVLFQDQGSDARAFQRQYGGSWPILEDPGTRTALDYGVAGPPETFFIDRRGIVRYKSTGPVTPQILAAEIPRLLGSGR
jgi:cytochrome c biogenesis protein CcmG/thiol:disulfide interchange protein DsbE